MYNICGTRLKIMNTANIPAAHLNPQQIRLFTTPSGVRKRWIWSRKHDHLELLAASVAAEALRGQNVIVWYDEETAAADLLNTFPLDTLEKAIYSPAGFRQNGTQHAIKPLSTESIHHIELYKLTEDIQNLNRPWRALHDEVWPGANRYDLIRRFAGLFNHIKTNPLYFRLSRTNFEITPAEYKRLRHKIEHYIKLSRLRQDGFEHLDLLDINLLSNHSLDFVKSEVMQYVALVAEQGNDLLKRADWIMLRYFEFVKTYWIREINIFVNKIDKLISHIRELQLTYGDAFSFESSLSQLAQTIKGQVNRKVRMISQDRKEIKTRYSELLTEVEEGQPWVIIPDEQKYLTAVQEVIDYLTQLKSQLLSTKDSIEAHIRSQLKRLNSLNTPDDTGLKSVIREWEEDLLKWYSNINVSGYFKTRFESQALSIHKSVEGLREVTQALNAIVERQHFLEDFFFWAGFQQQFPDNARSIVHALQLVPVQDWLTCFDEWYITQLLTGDALEVEWPDDFAVDLREITERLRHHAFAEFMHDVTQKRILQNEQQGTAIRKLVDRKSQVDEEAAERFFRGMSPDLRAEWYPIQLLPISSMPNRMPEKTESFYILLKSNDPSLLSEWQHVQEMACDVYAYHSPYNQRFISECLDMPTMESDFRTGLSHTSTAYKYLNSIAKHFAPFLPNTCIYSAHRVNVISLLGPELDRLVLDQLPMPYKISERSLHPDENFLIECLLEPHKPFVLLMRDFWPTGAWPDNVLWHLDFQHDLDKLGIKIIHSWSKGWLNEPNQEIRRVRDEILHFVGSSFTGLHTV